MSGLRPGCPARGFQIGIWTSKLDLGAEIDDFGDKIDGISWMEMGKLGDMLDPLETKQIHGSKSTKLPQTNKSQKKIGAIFGGDFQT